MELFPDLANMGSNEIDDYWPIMDIEPLSEPWPGLVTLDSVGQLLQSAHYRVLDHLGKSGRLTSKHLVDYGFISYQDPLGIIHSINRRWLIDTFFSQPRDRNPDVVSFLMHDCYNEYIIQYLVIKSLHRGEIDPENWIRVISDVEHEGIDMPMVVIDIFVKLEVPLPPDRILDSSIRGRTTAYELILYSALSSPMSFCRLVELLPQVQLVNVDQEYLEQCLQNYDDEVSLETLWRVRLMSSDSSGW